MKIKKLVCAMAALAGTLGLMAETPLWMRCAQISPDGSQIVFAYKGDLYRVASAGGTAVQLTTLTSHETHPVWSPDGQQIAFASDREGGMDIYVMPSQGGTPRRLTSNSAGETPWAFSADGRYIYFSAAIQDAAQSMLFPTSRLTELYQVPVAGGPTTRVLGTPAEWVNVSPDGRFMLYQDQKGMESAWRKHHVSSVTRDVWRYDFATGRHTNLTARAGEDRNPVLGADGRTVYILSERSALAGFAADGPQFLYDKQYLQQSTQQVYSFPLDNPSQVTQVTHFSANPVRFLSVARNGLLCYTHDGRLYTQQPGGEPREVSVTLWHDDSDQIKRIAKTSGATDAAVSPDGKQVAMVVRGEVFVTSVEYATTKRITNTAAAENWVSWGSDNRSLAYATERGGHWQLVLARIARKDDPNFANATTVTEEILLPDSKHDYTHPQLSPDGKKLAFVEDRYAIKVMDLQSRKVTQVTDGSQWFDAGTTPLYSWSPDSRWIAMEYMANGRDPYADIGIVSAQGGPVTNITQSAYICQNPKWVMGGTAIMFGSNRYGMRSHASWGSQDDVFLAFVNQEALDRYRLNKEDYELLKDAEKKAKDEEKKAEADKKGKDKKKDAKAENKPDDKPVTVELEGIQDRIERVTPNSSRLGDYVITPEGDNLYYLSAFEKDFDLWKCDLRKHEAKLVSKLNGGNASLQLSKDGKEIFLLGDKKMQKLTVAGDKLTPITYNAEMKMDLAQERDYMFSHVEREVDKRFYNTNYHGVDWHALCDYYRQFLPHINNNYDFSELLSELLGELNVSHTGSGYRHSGAEATADLGLIYDYSYTGPGLRVEEVVKGGPFDKAGSGVRRGTVIEKINGQDITPEADYTMLLNGQAGRKTLVSYNNGGTRGEQVVKPIGATAMSGLLYNRWVKRNAHLVDSLSNGRLGYVHLQSMNDASYRDVYSQVLGKYNRCEGIIIDTRWNGGGRLHEDIEILFSGKKYLTQKYRGREACDMPSRRWNKPSIMLQCEANYSNAHGTPWVYKHDGLGKLVGAPVPGTMTSVNWETLQDESMYFGIPVIGYEQDNGYYLENSQLEPDILILNDPATVVTGEDKQLKAAVNALLGR